MWRGLDDAAAADASVCVGVKPDEYFAFLAVFKRGGGVGRAAQVGDDFVGGLVGSGEDDFSRGRRRIAAQEVFRLPQKAEGRAVEDKNGSARLAACAVGKYGGNAADACAVTAADFLIEDGVNVACSGGTDKAGCEKKGGGELAEYGFCKRVLKGGQSEAV